MSARSTERFLWEADRLHTPPHGWALITSRQKIPMKMILKTVVGVLFTAAVAFAAPALSEIAVAFGPAEFSEGDSIIVDQVLGTSPKLEIGDRVVVRGRYRLASQARAKLGLSLTRTESREPVPISPAANKQVAKGAGEFELVYEVKHVGCMHVSLSDTSDGRSFGTVYFGTPEQLARVHRSPR